jgi:gamma-glutamylaminecyclotransferase
MAMDKELLFVYGTLKRGYANNERCIKRAPFVGEAFSVGNFQMRNIGFPVIWEDEKGTKVSGEIFEITRAQRDRCDILEGHPRMYKREAREFLLNDGKIVTAWVYIYQNPKYVEKAPECQIVDGAWFWEMASRKASG